MDISDAVNNAIERTRYLLFEQRTFPRWRNYALLHALTAGGGGGGGGGDISELFKGDEKTTSARAVMGCSLLGALGAQASGAEVAIIVAILVPFVLLGLYLLYLSSVLRLVLVENIVHDRQAIVEPFRRLKHLGWSVYIWSLVWTMLFLAAMAVLVGLPGYLIYQAGSGAYLGFLPLALWGLFLCLAVATMWVLFNECVVPLMYRENVNATQAWGLLLPLLKAAPGQWCLFIVIRALLCMGFLMASGIVALLMVLVAALAIAIVIGLPTAGLYLALRSNGGEVVGIAGLVLGGLLFLAAAIVLGLAAGTPVTVAIRSFSLYAMQQLAPQYGFLPLGGRPVHIQVLRAEAAGTGLNPTPAETPEPQPEPDQQPV
ncbi:MAG: hypothetical protein AB1758_18590 [Candidatus Eremiobacterota bacterium]